MSEPVMLSAIDRALAAAKARKAAKEAAGVEPEAVAAPKMKKVHAPKIKLHPDVKAEKIIDPSVLEHRAAVAAARAEAKASKLAQFEADRAARKAVREVKVAARAATKTVVVPAHLKKVERAKAKLPQLNEKMQALVDNIVSSFSLHQLDAIAMHMQLHARAEKTRLASKGGALPIGASVTIFGGDPRYIGKVGTVVTSQKLRATVAVDGAKKPVYIYTSEAKVNG